MNTVVNITRLEKPAEITDPEKRFDAFSNGKVVSGKMTGRLPAMGWNSWNAFGSGNTEELTLQMADKLVELGLRDLGYEYVVLDDGCYKPEREGGLLANEEVKFPSGFRALADQIHQRGLKFGMYNDIGTNLCAGAAVGTCGHELDDARSYVNWGVDFLKVDNCYYLWDNATFSDGENARFTFAPAIKEIRFTSVETGECVSVAGDALRDGIVGDMARYGDGVVTGIGTFDGTGPLHSPVGIRSSEIKIMPHLADGIYSVELSYATAKKEGQGAWLQLAVETDGVTEYLYDDLLPETEGEDAFELCKPFVVSLHNNTTIRLMNHRRQENTLDSYACLVEALDSIGCHNMVLSICEWGKTQPQNWGYKVGDSWRILNDITFQVGADGDPGVGAWTSDYTTGVTAQYNKAVIMDEFAGLSLGWNDPDMMMIGMNGLTEAMNRTHMAMWCMMNSPLMLGLDLRRVEKGDALWKIIANKDLIALGQDPLGVQAKRIMTTAPCADPSTAYLRENDRIDVLAKPLFDGAVAISVINLDASLHDETIDIPVSLIVDKIGQKMVHPEVFSQANTFEVRDLWTGERSTLEGRVLRISGLEAYENKTMRISIL